MVRVASGFLSTKRPARPRLGRGAVLRFIAMSDAMRTRYSGCVRRSTMPRFLAARALNRRPVRIASSASAGPIRRGRRVEPPHAGRMPSMVSGRPMRVEGASAATIRSQASASSYAPPGTGPPTAATVRGLSLAMRLNRACPARTLRDTSAGSSTSAIASTSAPAAKLSGSRPVITTPCGRSFSISSSARSRSRRSATSSTASLRCGGSSTSTTRPSSGRSIRMQPPGSGAPSGRGSPSKSIMPPSSRGAPLRPGRRRCTAWRATARYRRPRARARPSAGCARRSRRPDGRGRWRRRSCS